jgi:hypothetical protein
MSIEKESMKDAPGKADQPEHKIEEDESSISMSRQGIDVMSLEIAPDSDSGGDPYNRTGSYCVIKVKE